MYIGKHSTDIQDINIGYLYILSLWMIFIFQFLIIFHILQVQNNYLKFKYQSFYNKI